MHSKKIFIVGIPRSGTTWLASVLSQARTYKYIHEPDNERHTYTAFYYKRGLERFPYFSQFEESSSYSKLFEKAFFGNHINMGSDYNELLFRLGSLNKAKIENWLQRDLKNPLKNCPEYKLYPFLPKSVHKNEENRIIKSVHAGLSISYILQQFKIPTLIILRHPASVISSYLRMGNPDIDRKLYLNEKLIEDHFNFNFPDIKKFTSSLNYAGLQVAILYSLIYKATKAHKHIKLVFHEDICKSPVDSFKSIYKDLNIEWSEDVQKYILDNNQAGSGYETKRIAKNNINTWKNELNPNQIKEIEDGYFSLEAEFYKDFK